MIVASFYAPRKNEEEKRWGSVYDDILMVLDKSCKRFDLRHIVISDSSRPKPLETFLCELPENLIKAFFVGQETVLREFSEKILFVGADCVIVKDPREMGEFQDIAITTSDEFSDCQMNTGAIWCNDTKKCVEVWIGARARNPVKWGQDQRALYESVKAEAAIGLKVFELRAEDHNWAPENINDNAGFPTVAHFRGPRKSFMRAWAERHLGI